MRLEKKVDRYIRFALSDLEIADLPTGARMRWVNQLAEKLERIAKSDMPIAQLEEICDRIVEKSIKELKK